jgi:hypothetical protein
MEGVFWFGLGVVTGMACLPWVQDVAARMRRMLLELDEPVAPPAATDEERHRF